MKEPTKWVIDDSMDLNRLATEALNPAHTDQIFLQHSQLFTEICAQWIQTNLGTDAKIAAFGRIIPLAPHLVSHLEHFIKHASTSEILGAEAPQTPGMMENTKGEASLIETLLAAFRLLSLDCQKYTEHVRPLALEALFAHSNRVVRYLAVRTFCSYVYMADNATQEAVRKYVGDGNIDGDWEGQRIDYRFLSLWEERRWKILQREMISRMSRRSEAYPASIYQNLSPFTTTLGGVLLPRLDGAPPRESSHEVIPTATTESNLSVLSKALLNSQPILLTGLAGSGKTLLVRHVAKQLNRLNRMVTLHLNEQSDAKLLIGMYTAGKKPGTFSWRPGVLTTAVQEGRWVFIEDLDRAPNEVVSILLPLIERGELVIPSRGQIVRAAEGFRIIATMTSVLNSRGQETLPRSNMIGYRFWRSLSMKMPQQIELSQIISARFPSLRPHLSSIIAVFARLLNVYADAKFVSANGVSTRSITPRDLFKWCQRSASLLSQSTTFSTAQRDDIFMEAVDCFAGSLHGSASAFEVTSCIAEELHIDPQRRDHLLKNRILTFSVPPSGSALSDLGIGRARITRIRPIRKPASSRVFSVNHHTLRVLEKVAVAVNHREPLLLVGETGTGKTTCIQYLAEQLGQKVIAYNLSQQSESGDLLGGFKPVNVRTLIIFLKDEFDDLFDTTFSRKKNLRFLEMLGKRIAKGEWKRVCTLWREALKMVDGARNKRESRISGPDLSEDQPKKKRKTGKSPIDFPNERWKKFATDLYDLEAQLESGPGAFAFSFVEGNIVKAVRDGDWVLLDEINLASSDTLEALTDLFGGGLDDNPSILLTESGNVERVFAHPNFRVFAAMNPATDVGKKDLPPSIRSRFTELYIDSPDSDEKSLRDIVERYLSEDDNRSNSAIVKLAEQVTRVYLDIQQLAKSSMIVDGADEKPHFSLRTLTRTLSYARDMAQLCGIHRALFEGFHMSFLTFLSTKSEDVVAEIIFRHLFSQQKNVKAQFSKPLRLPFDGREYVRQGHYWLLKGRFPVEEQSNYIITPFVQRNMNNLIRAASTRKYPVLIQGPTSSGKTSMIEYLAKRSGNKFVRINNHEHTDLQEYLGSYMSDADGKLTFQEGILVRALREGHWIVLDELNLAPTDVLEALNRLLDDNRELLIPETQEVVRPHPDFMLYATQNPAGLYGGRKVLSRAFRNRFLELHFDDIPVDELSEILHKRSLIPESWCKRIVKVYRELSTLRQENRVFEQKSFATLRDLFRWAQRKADTVQDLANNGYMLLAERVRKDEERVAVKHVLERIMSEKGPRVTINEEEIFRLDGWLDMKSENGDCDHEFNGVVWTGALRRLFVLVAQALRNNEPVLLIGETGCGKTTVCQLLADHFQTHLRILNAHQNTETGDLIGAQRPIRNRVAIEETLRHQLLDILERAEPSETLSNLKSLSTSRLLDIYDNLKVAMPDAISMADRALIQAMRAKAVALFEWADGSLVTAMKAGQFFLLDEISLADDSVLERLNSVLEPSRTLLLAEKGPEDSHITAQDGFQFLATMNPGGDYGKKELSPALRNRFTEIWVPAMSNMDDILKIVDAKLKPGMTHYAEAIVYFSEWFNNKYNTSVVASVSIRDTLAWVSFINKSTEESPIFAIVHGAALVFIDTLGANPAGLMTISPTSIEHERRTCLDHLGRLLGEDLTPLYFGAIGYSSTKYMLQLGAFSMQKVALLNSSALEMSFEALTTRRNAMRVMRALQLDKPILLEGNPGVGKTTLVTALARAIGKPLTRLNLSEQTDLMDLFGSDVPVDGASAGTFAWRDAPFLKAMKLGEWVLLDEMNLASQSILEGLNAVLDHRGEVYIAELDQKFLKHPEFRVFAAQNPHHQGGGRKGLPVSFANRFTIVYADVLVQEDMDVICKKAFPQIEDEVISKLTRFVTKLDQQVVTERKFGHLGAPWEFNLRDTLRWLQLVASSGSARDFLDVIFSQRFRTEDDRRRIEEVFSSIYGSHDSRISLFHNLTAKYVQVGLGVLPRSGYLTRPERVRTLRPEQLGPLEALLISIQCSWPVIVAGPSGSGKTALLNQAASAIGANLVVFAMNADIDAMDLVGGYEQMNLTREVNQCIRQIEAVLRQRIAALPESLKVYVSLLEYLLANESSDSTTLRDELQYLERTDPNIVEMWHQLQTLQASMNKHFDGARFHWVNGILIRALEEGNWLVLDNANLCSSAVLDRLNSLLEPEGYLSVNEHSTADGEAQVIRPHSNFRIFMTMDPKHGELSRAMRNRAVEIYMTQNANDSTAKGMTAIEYPLDSAMYRFRHIQNNEVQALDALELQFENLSHLDDPLMSSFVKQMHVGLKAIPTSATNDDIFDSPMMDVDLISASNMNSDEQIRAFSQFLSQKWTYKRLAQYSASRRKEQDQLASYHPLGNELLLTQSYTTQSYGRWLTSLYDTMLNIHKMKQAIKDLPTHRSDHAKDMRKLVAFLHAYYEEFTGLVSSISTQDLSQLEDIIGWSQPLRKWFWAFLELSKASAYDRATMQTYIEMLRSIIHGEMFQRTSTLRASASRLSQQLSQLGSDIQLTSGFGMERIWQMFRPQTPKTLRQLKSLLQLESLADRLDEIIWKSSLEIDEMVQIRERFAKSLCLARQGETDTDELLVSLDGAVKILENNVLEDTYAVSPYFEEQFESLCQFSDLAIQTSSAQAIKNSTVSSSAAAVVRAKWSLLARRPTKLEVIDARSCALPSENFDKLSHYLGLVHQTKSSTIASGQFHVALLAKLHSIDDIRLWQLDQFVEEIEVFSEGLLTNTHCIVQNPDSMLSDVYHQIRNNLCESHGDVVFNLIEHGDVIFLPNITITDAHQALIRDTILASDLNPNERDAEAWVKLGMFGLRLYVPNHAFDPALAPLVRCRMFNEKQSDLNYGLEALRAFQIDFTGQDTSFRIREVEQDLLNMGEEPPLPAIVRPKTYQVDQLQGEFSNLLSVLEPLMRSSYPLQAAMHDSTLQQNIAHIMQRLKANYREYADITSPAVGFLICLKIGLFLGKKEEEERSQSLIRQSLAQLCANIPLFGRKKDVVSPAFIEELNDALRLGGQDVNMRKYALLSLSALKRNDSDELLLPAARQLLHELFTSFYSDWKEKLLRDQETEAQSSSLYTYRGMDDNVDERDPELFPDYEAKEGEREQFSVNTAQSRGHTIELASLHAGVFLPNNGTSDPIKTLLEWGSAEMNRVSGGSSHGTRHIDALPAIYLVLEKRSDALFSNVSKAYNFYFDANLAEAKAFITFVHRVQRRYREIQKVWPEHATLSDVLRSCDESLDFRHVDPVAKFITKAEKLHGYMYEWQRVASREYSTTALFDDLTKLLISWRKIELTTWTKLFDMEVEKCSDDARSWFFVAYETIIAASESVRDDKITLFAKDLLKSLENFFDNTTLGQFEQRLMLLRQLHEHIKMRAQDVEHIETIGMALENFINYFSRFTESVQKTLAKGRQELETQIRDVIKLASWKDVNIEALKQSAKKSHLALTKLVRKFRALLNQPVAGVLKSGIPPQDYPTTEPALEKVTTTIDEDTRDICACNVLEWTGRAARFRNLDATTSLMIELSTPTPDTINGTTYLNEFISSLSSSIAELQKATPSVLLEDNKHIVQHLKIQKRKVYADTMKELRQMGVISNLSTDILARQDELSTVLSVLPSVNELGNKDRAGNYFLQKTLNIMPQVRAIYKEHSGDLTPNDISRSIGYIEGLLHLCISQRQRLSKATQVLENSEQPVKLLSNLAQQDARSLARLDTSQLRTIVASLSKLRWLTAILRTGTDIVCAQKKLAKTNVVDEIISQMTNWTNKLEQLASSYDYLPTLPEGLLSNQHRAWVKSLESSLDQLRNDFTAWLEQGTFSNILLTQIAPYIFKSSLDLQQGDLSGMDASLGDFTQSVFTCLDLVLLSVQRVQNELKEIPESTEGLAWLLREEEALSAAIDALESPQISRNLQRILKSMQYLHNDSDVQSATALFTSASPIVFQYLAIHKYLFSRLDNLHRSTTHLLYCISKSFIQVGTQGFCQPSDKSSDQQDKDEKLESGTGLGEGEGAEDISKDVGEDEDLDELAQEQKGDREGSIEEQDDAVDMGEQEMEGEIGETGEKEDKGDQSSNESYDDVQSEVGSVNDLGANTLDEKMWNDGSKNDNAKDKEGQQGGMENQDEQVAAEQGKESQYEEDDNRKEEQQADQQEQDIEIEGEDQEENINAGEIEMLDPHLKQEETLDLPEDLNMDGQEGSKNDEDVDDIDMDGELEEENDGSDKEPDAVKDAKEETGEEETGEETDPITDGLGADDQPETQSDDGQQDGIEDDALALPNEDIKDSETNGAKDAADTSQNTDGIAGVEGDDEVQERNHNRAAASATKEEVGQEGQESESLQETPAVDGKSTQTADQEACGKGGQAEDSRETQSLKKLGDILDKWYNQQREIFESREKDQRQVQQTEKEIDTAHADFEHILEEEQADTQAIGTATEEQARALDHDMAIPVDETEEKTRVIPEDNDDIVAAADEDVNEEDLEPPISSDEKEEERPNHNDGQVQTFIGEQRPNHIEEQDSDDKMDIDDNEFDMSSVKEVETRLQFTHLDPATVDPENARDLWLLHEAATHSLSQQLTEHLRLILAPTLATKLRGDFQSGKRLNLKRIIPYIASGYKRDKIWLRRSQPSKRSYQVMIALDDSKSMAENGASNLALKTLTLVTKSLAMLEVGEVSVVGFGDKVNVAHEFDKPFTSEAGIRVFEQFGFQATKTNVKGLVDSSLESFAEARRRRSNSASEGLWQLMLVVSDGICDSHAEIQRLVREAQSARVMIVFIIIDSNITAPKSTVQSSSDAQATAEKGNTSILDLQSVEITKEGTVVRWKYMERFPFKYYLVVRDVRELPSVLAGALRQWFGEVAGSA